MHVLVIGGSGRNGQLVIQEALTRGHSVTALLRSPSSVDASQLPNASNFTAVKGTPLSSTDVSTALRTPMAPSAIIVALSPRHANNSTSPFSAHAADTPPTLILDSLTILIKELQSSSLAPKIVLNSAQGTGSSWSSLPMAMKLVFRYTAMKASREDHDAADEKLRKSGLSFVLARATRLVDDSQAERKKQVKVWGDDGKGVGMMGSIGRGELAGWMVDAAEKGEWDGRAPVLTSE